jgi:hypothetical protein
MSWMRILADNPVEYLAMHVQRTFHFVRICHELSAISGIREGGEEGRTTVVA